MKASETGRFYVWHFQDPMPTCAWSFDNERDALYQVYCDLTEWTGSLHSEEDHLGIHWFAGADWPHDTGRCVISVRPTDMLPGGPAVYFAGTHEGAVKIGRTDGDIYQRIRRLSTGSPNPLRVLGAIAAERSVETEIHQLLRAARVHGEWFGRERAFGVYRMLAHEHPRAVLAHWWRPRAPERG